MAGAAHTQRTPGSPDGSVVRLLFQGGGGGASAGSFSGSTSVADLRSFRQAAIDCEQALAAARAARHRSATAAGGSRADGRGMHTANSAAAKDAAQPAAVTKAASTASSSVPLVQHHSPRPEPSRPTAGSSAASHVGACAICVEPYSAAAVAYRGECGHRLCHRCLERLVVACCPFCRQPWAEPASLAEVAGGGYWPFRVPEWFGSTAATALRLPLPDGSGRCVQVRPPAGTRAGMQLCVAFRVWPEEQRKVCLAGGGGGGGGAGSSDSDSDGDSDEDSASESE